MCWFFKDTKRFGKMKCMFVSLWLRSISLYLYEHSENTIFERFVIWDQQYGLEEVFEST